MRKIRPYKLKVRYLLKFLLLRILNVLDKEFVVRP